MMNFWLLILRFWLQILVKPHIVNADTLPASLTAPDDADTPPPPRQHWYVLRSHSWAEALILEKYCQNSGHQNINLHTHISTNSTGTKSSAAHTAQPPLLYLHRRGFRQMCIASQFTARASGVRPNPTSPRRCLKPGTASNIQNKLGDPEQSPILIPISFFWGRAPERSHSLWKLLLSESWKKPNTLKKALRIFWHGRECSICFGAPISLADHLNRSSKKVTPKTTDKTKSQQCRKLFRLCRRHFRQMRIAAIGPDLSHRRQMTHTVISSPQVRQAIEQTANTAQPNARRVARKKARRYALEIASDYAHSMVRAYHLILSRLWHRLYDGLAVYGMSRVQAIAQTHTLIYVPCHRSHMDYLLLPYLLYNAGLAPPHTAAGINLNLPVIGRLLRHGGAFFLRRQFKGDALYTAVFQSYLAVMLTQGFSLAFFLEGGRSRSGRLLAPKMGMINMILKNHYDNLAPKNTKPLAFVPVYIGYEKLFEANAYIKELSGIKKQPETISGLLRSLQRLRYHFGQVHIQFAEPLRLPQPLDHTHINPATPLRTQVQQLGLNITRSINNAAVIADINLVSLVLLSAPRHALDENILLEQLALYQAMLINTSTDRQWIVSQKDPKEMVAQAEQLGLIQRQSLFLGDLLIAHPSKALLLTYFKNNCLHTVCLPALLACTITADTHADLQTLTHFTNAVIPMLQEELSFYFTPQQLNTSTEKFLHFFHTHSLIQETTLTSGSESSTETKRLEHTPISGKATLRLTLMAQMIRPCLERYLVALSFIRNPKTPITTTATLVDLLQQNIQRLAILAEFNAPEFFDLKLVQTLVAGMETLEWIQWESTVATSETPQTEHQSLPPSIDNSATQSVRLTTHGESIYQQLRHIAGDKLVPLLNL